MKVFGIVGWKNSGKTGLVERLVTELVLRGFTVSTVKHAHHSFDVDHPGRDSYRHRDAGAREVMLGSSNRWALMHELKDQPEPTMEELLAKMSPVDLILVEGFKGSAHPKLECNRHATGQDLIAPSDPTIVAVASDTEQTVSGIKVLDLNDTATIAEFVLAEVGL